MYVGTVRGLPNPFIYGYFSCFAYRVSAFPNLSAWAELVGRTARDMTALGTNMVVMAKPWLPSVNESIELHSTPNIATTSPAPT
jgi:hypothetical protein